MEGSWGIPHSERHDQGVDRKSLESQRQIFRQLAELTAPTSTPSKGQVLLQILPAQPYRCNHRFLEVETSQALLLHRFFCSLYKNGMTHQT